MAARDLSIGYDALALSVLDAVERCSRRLPAAAATAEAVAEVHRGLGSFIERRKGDQLLELWNEAGDEAWRQGMMLMGHCEDDAGTSEAVIESGDGGRAVASA